MSGHSHTAHASTARSVYFYSTCLVDQFVPQAGLDAVRLLEREGYTVVFPENQTCCGQPAYTSGQPDEARAVAAAQLDLFPNDWPIIVASGSCAGMMMHHWPKLFSPGSPEHTKALALNGRIREFAQFLVDIGFQRPDQGEPVKVALHTSCSARREMNTHLAGRQLLAGLAQVERVEHGHEAECCGFGGTFSLRHPEISAAMVADKVQSLRDSGATQVVSADSGCLLNILGHAEYAGQRLPGEHLASFLWRRTNDEAQSGGAA